MSLLMRRRPPRPTSRTIGRVLVCLGGFVLVAGACDDSIVLDAVIVESAESQACATSDGGKRYCFDPVVEGLPHLEVGDCVEVELAPESARLIGVRAITCES